ncbi:MAG: biotin/lipoyl-binding protein, partial [Planctomycetes bacterium]|nr:biotin/lipoyl-binding protein [Planctomycetota bacterium]
MYEVVMPRLSDSMEEGKIIKWKVRQGDAVREGDVLAEIESDKAVMELECFHDGRVDRIVRGDGDEVPVGEVIAYLSGPGEHAGPAEAPAREAAPPSEPAAREVPAAAPVPPPPSPAPSPAPPPPEPAATPREGRVTISPYARKLAEARGIDYAKVKGTGPRGNIVAEDVEQAARLVAQAQPPRVEPVPVKAPPAPAPRRGGAVARPAAPEPEAEPLAAALIKRFRLDPSMLRGTGAGGLIMVDDVLAMLCARPQPAARPPADEELPALEVTEEEADVEDAPFRLKTQARRVTAAKHVIPHFYVTTSADVTRLLARREELKAKMGATVTHLVMLACLKALRQHPDINRTWDRGRIIRWKHVNLGLAVET